MAVSRDFVDHVGELFAPLGTIRSQRMFSGVGVYADDLIFAFLVDDTLYLRVDPDSEARFRRLAESSPELIAFWRLRPEPHFTWISPALRTVVGLDPADVLARPDALLAEVFPRDLPALTAALADPSSVEQPLLVLRECHGRDDTPRGLASHPIRAGLERRPPP